MIRFLVIRFLFPLLVFFLVRSLLKSVLASFQTYRSSPPQRQMPQPPPVPAGGELKKDPVCGTYVSTSGSVSRTVNGEVVYFCSAQCRDRYKVA
jgi:YHS domain-containing protein